MTKSLFTKKILLIYLLLFISTLIISLGFFYLLNNGYLKPLFKGWADKTIIVIDPGHGGFDPGATYGEVLEKDINLEISLILADLLEKHNDYAIIMTRKEDENPAKANSRDRILKSLQKRKTVALQYRADIFISIHTNSTKNKEARGPIVFYKEDNREAQKLAHSIQEKLWALNPSFRTALPGNFYLTNEIEGYTVLVEVGFLSNKEDRELLLDPDFQKNTAQAIYSAIKEFAYK